MLSLTDVFANVWSDRPVLPDRRGMAAPPGVRILAVIHFFDGLSASAAPSQSAYKSANFGCCARQVGTTGCGASTGDMAFTWTIILRFPFAPTDASKARCSISLRVAPRTFRQGV